ncbi:MAG: hypothetical protein GKS02_06870 [Alphaproteobacteria bacterium]|nr:hypothetical protein [Alphaproteobacteria bacterium]
MGDSGGRKRSKKSKRSKREKAAKKVRAAKLAERTQSPHSEDASVAEPALSEASQELVIELQRTELSRLLREQQRLNDRVDQLLQLHEREQVLRQQMQAALDNLSAQRVLPSPERNDVEQARLIERVDKAESKFSALQSAVGLLVAVLERQAVSA